MTIEKYVKITAQNAEDAVLLGRMWNRLFLQKDDKPMGIVWDLNLSREDYLRARAWLKRHGSI